MKTYTLRFMLKALCFFLVSSAMAQENTLGIFTNHIDVGNTKTEGSTIYDTEKQSYTLSGSGENIWNQKDEFQYAYRKLEGDFILRAHMSLVGEGVSIHTEKWVGWCATAWKQTLLAP